MAVCPPSVLSKLVLTGHVALSCFIHAWPVCHGPSTARSCTVLFTLVAQSAGLDSDGIHSHCSARVLCYISLTRTASNALGTAVSFLICPIADDESVK